MELNSVPSCKVSVFSAWLGAVHPISLWLSCILSVLGLLVISEYRMISER